MSINNRKTNDKRTKFSIGFIFAVSLCFSQITSAQEIPSISPEQFTGIMNTISEPGGYYRSDIWVTNEWAYLNVIEPLKELKVQGGVYIGVAANQNFSYIAAIKPELAFIVDIRHQNRMQHLMYKVMFELAETRTEFLSLLFARPLDGDNIPGKDSDVNRLVDFFYTVQSDRNMFTETLDRIIEILITKYKFELNEQDRWELNNVMNAFYIYNLSITSGGSWGRNRPTLADLMILEDPQGKQLNIFNRRDDYLFVRNMHIENKIIPVTGNFAGTGALLRLAEYLKERNLTVSAFYVSNVEQYLFQDGIFANWARNVKKLPINDKSIFIRWVSGNYRSTRLQWMNSFVKNFDAGRYGTYGNLSYYDYIYN